MGRNLQETRHEFSDVLNGVTHPHSIGQQRYVTISAKSVQSWQQEKLISVLGFGGYWLFVFLLGVFSVLNAAP